MQNRRRIKWIFNLRLRWLIHTHTHKHTSHRIRVHLPLERTWISNVYWIRKYINSFLFVKVYFILETEKKANQCPNSEPSNLFFFLPLFTEPDCFYNGKVFINYKMPYKHNLFQLALDLQIMWFNPKVCWILLILKEWDYIENNGKSINNVGKAILLRPILHGWMVWNTLSTYLTDSWKVY